MGRVHGAVRTTTISTSARQIIGPSDKRVALVFSPPAGSSGETYSVSTEPTLTNVASGLQVTSGGPLEITRERHGDAVTRPWYAVASAGALTTIAYLEVVSE